jgi:FixJ family two-component response regulator
MIQGGAPSSKGFRCGDDRRADDGCITIGGRMSEMDAIVFVVDDDPSVRRSTERLLRSAGFDVRMFASAKEFREHPPVDRPACIVLDVKMPGLSGLDLQRELADSGVRIPIVFITGRGTISMSVRAMKEGAIEFLTKPVRSRDLLAAIETAIERDRAAARDRRERSALRERYDRLTAREREVLAFVIAGLQNKAIAAELAMTERTVKFHRAHVMSKMQAESIVELVRLAEQLRIAPRGVPAPVPKDR